MASEIFVKNLSKICLREQRFACEKVAFTRRKILSSPKAYPKTPERRESSAG